MKIIKIWIEAMRLRTLPVSLAGVIAGLGCALLQGTWRTWPAVLCLAFALLAQIASNFANEYYDFKSGLDKPGREGPRRGVTEGDITPRAMLIATYGVLAAACIIGCSLIIWGGWWLIIVGIAIALGVVAYSTGPYPLSHHGWGEVAVLFFFGIIPVNFTYYLQTDLWSINAFATSVSIGLMGANVLIINNYRDMADDKAVGKNTLAVKIGLGRTSALYLLDGLIAVILMIHIWMDLRPVWWIIPSLYLATHIWMWLRMKSLKGSHLNPLLGGTAMLMLFYALGLLFGALA